HPVAGRPAAGRPASGRLGLGPDRFGRPAAYLGPADQADSCSHSPWKFPRIGFLSPRRKETKAHGIRSRPRAAALQPQSHPQIVMPDSNRRKIVFLGYTGPVDSEGVGRIAAALNDAVNNHYDEVQLSFSSLGGYVADGIYLYNH